MFLNTNCDVRYYLFNYPPLLNVIVEYTIRPRRHNNNNDNDNYSNNNNNDDNNKIFIYIQAF